MNELVKKYLDYFTPEDKIKAFDEIAKNYYYANFGSMSKSDLETLMFSIYIEKILEISVKEADTFSDYTLSKCLGITQQKINNLKIRKELKYPREKFNWKKAFIAGLNNAVVDKEKIKVFIDDPNIAIEVKHAIELNGGFTDSSFNPKICVISPRDFLDLILAICDEEEVENIRTNIQVNLNNNDAGLTFLRNRPFGKQLMESGVNFGLELLGDLLNNIPFVGNSISQASKKNCRVNKK